MRRPLLRSAPFLLFREVGMGFEVTDIGDYRGLSPVYSGYVPSHAPARAAVEVSDLMAGAIVEISFIAVKP